MKIRSFILAYALVVAILLFADHRPGSAQPGRYSHVVDLTDGQSLSLVTGVSSAKIKSNTTAPLPNELSTRIIAPAALIPGTWSAGQIPAERLIAPLVVLDLKAASPATTRNNDIPEISLDDISAWESQHGMIPQGAVIAVRRPVQHGSLSPSNPSDAAPSTFPITRDAALFLLEARYSIGFAVETPVTLSSDHTLARELALHGTYIVEGAARFSSLPATGSIVIVAPAKNKKSSEAPVRVLAMVR